MHGGLTEAVSRKPEKHVCMPPDSCPALGQAGEDRTFFAEMVDDSIPVAASADCICK
jgi:hypothetical protein